MDTQLSSKRPYLLRAMHDWMTENGQTPHVVVDAECPGVVLRSIIGKDHPLTGLLRVNPQHSLNWNRYQLRLSWARIERGRPRPLPDLPTPLAGDIDTAMTEN